MSRAARLSVSVQDSSPGSTAPDWPDSKADNWLLRQCPKVLNLPFKEDVGRPDRDNAIDVYMSDDYADVLEDGQWQQFYHRTAGAS